MKKQKVTRDNKGNSVQILNLQAKVTRDEKGNWVQILNLQDINVILNIKDEIFAEVYYKDTIIHDYFPYGSAHPVSYKKTITCNLARRIIVFCNWPWENRIKTK